MEIHHEKAHLFLGGFSLGHLRTSAGHRCWHIKTVGDATGRCRVGWRSSIGTEDIPVNIQKLLNMAIYSEFSHSKWRCSIGKIGRASCRERV